MPLFKFFVDCSFIFFDILCALFCLEQKHIVTKFYDNKYS